jgi:antitoxin Phd
MAWQVQDAKARFSEFLDASLRDGPQVVTRRGVEAAVLVAITEWRGLTHVARPTLKQLLLAPEAEAQFDIPVPARGELRRRQPRGSA